MRITDALKPVTDALAAAGMSLDTATYKDGKIHATLSTEAPKATGKPGSGPRCPPEGYRLLAPYDPENWQKDIPESGYCVYWNSGIREWELWLTGRMLATIPHVRYDLIAVPIAPKPEPVKLTDQEKIVGWRGPTGFRLQTFQNREVQCVICKKTIKAGERLARWRSKFPEAGDQDHVVGHPGNEENHSHAHVDCLYEVAVGLRGSGSVHNSLDYYKWDVPMWLREKRRKYDAQQSALDK